MYIGDEPRTESGGVSEVAAGVRMMAARPIEGGQYFDGTPGTDWYPVNYELSGTYSHGFLAAGVCSVAEDFND